MKIQTGVSLRLAVICSGWATERVEGAETLLEGILFRESFEDADLAGRGWYDGTNVRIVGNAAAGKGCIEYEWPDSHSGVKGSSAVRRLFEPTDEVSLRQFLMAPYFGPGLLPHAHKLWIDELAVGTTRIGPPEPNK